MYRLCPLTRRKNGWVRGMQVRGMRVWEDPGLEHVALVLREGARTSESSVGEAAVSR